MEVAVIRASNPDKNETSIIYDKVYRDRVRKILDEKYPKLFPDTALLNKLENVVDAVMEDTSYKSVIVFVDDVFVMRNASMLRRICKTNSVSFESISDLSPSISNFLNDLVKSGE